MECSECWTPTRTILGKLFEEICSYLLAIYSLWADDSFRDRITLVEDNEEPADAPKTTLFNKIRFPRLLVTLPELLSEPDELRVYDSRQGASMS